jgi:hypothetical protein
MTLLDCLPKNTIIVEDSPVGREGALNRGAHLCAVSNPDDVTWNKLSRAILEIEATSEIKPWKDDSLNVIIPMAGLGSRFAKMGYTFPKPLIDIDGKPMIQVVVENLNVKANYIFIVQREHYEKYSLKYLFNLMAPNHKVIFVDGLTEGAACTTLLAKEHINNDNPLLIANSDQFIEWNAEEVMYNLTSDKVDAGILTFKSTHPKWSYAECDEYGFVVRVAEKEVISENATCGVYYWKKGSDYVKYAEQMISKNVRVNNEFYVCPAFNEAVLDNKKIKTINVKKMWGLGTPEDLNTFMANYGK